MAKDTEKPASYFIVVAARKQGMCKVTYLFKLAESTIRTVHISKNSLKSILGWEDVMDHSPKEGVVT